MSQVQTPSVGRIVHYVSYGTPGGEYLPQCRAAIIAEVVDRRGFSDHNDEVCALAVLNPTGVFFNRCPHVEPGTEDAAVDRGVETLGGTWHWPERTEQPYDPSQANQHSTIPRPDRTPGVDVP